MTEPPKTVEEFDALLAKAKAAGLQPIMEWNASTSGGGLAFPLQNLMAAYGDHATINDWVFLKEGATIDTPEFLQAAQKLDEWIKKGYFPEDVNAIEYSDAAGRFGKGEGVFTFNGDWQNAGYDTDLPGKVGFFTFPEDVGQSAGVTYVIAAKSKNPDCAAFFLNWAWTERQGARDRRRRRRREPGRPARWLDAVGARGLGDRRDPRRRRRRHAEQRCDGLHRQRDELHLLRELDAGPAEAGRRPDHARSSSSRTSRSTGRPPSSRTATRTHRIGSSTPMSAPATSAAPLRGEPPGSSGGFAAITSSAGCSWCPPSRSTRCSSSSRSS